MTSFARVARGERLGLLESPSVRIISVIDSKTLAQLVLQAVGTVGSAELNPPATGTTTAYHSRVLLAMLTYCYTIGVYGSQEVEEMMYADAEFRALCGMNYPDWRQLKRFRRRNHEPLRRTLKETFRGAWRLTGRPGVPGETEAKRNADALPEWLAAEAQSRLEQAMFIDQMAVE